MPDWRYVAQSDYSVPKEVNGRTYKLCKYCKCCATQKVGLYTNHSSSEHTFPRDRSTPDTDDATASAGTHSAVEEIVEEGGESLT